MAIYVNIFPVARSGVSGRERDPTWACVREYHGLRKPHRIQVSSQLLGTVHILRSHQGGGRGFPNDYATVISLYTMPKND